MISGFSVAFFGVCWTLACLRWLGKKKGRTTIRPFFIAQLEQGIRKRLQFGKGPISFYRFPISAASEYPDHGNSIQVDCPLISFLEVPHYELRGFAAGSSVVPTHHPAGGAVFLGEIHDAGVFAGGRVQRLAGFVHCHDLISVWVGVPAVVVALFVLS